MSNTDPLKPPYPWSVQLLVERATVAESVDMWDDEIVEHTRRLLASEHGRVVSLDEIAAMYGNQVVADVATRTLRRQKDVFLELTERTGYSVSCHLCDRAGTDGSSKQTFSLELMCPSFELLHVALSAARLSYNSHGLNVNALSGAFWAWVLLTLRVCGKCAEMHADGFGEISLGPEECRRHPSWKRIYAAGFSTFVSPGEVRRRTG
jgi:hypothetical protein